MTNQAVKELSGRGMPEVFENFFKPGNEWVENRNVPVRTMNVPSVNRVGSTDAYLLSMAVPGMKKSDFKMDPGGNMITVSPVREGSRMENDRRFTRKEYSYSSFSRRFILPDDVIQGKTDACYVEGVFKIFLPCNENYKKSSAKHIAVK